MTAERLCVAKEKHNIRKGANHVSNASKPRRLLPSPYGDVSFRQLTIMKLIDRHSICISGIPDRFASIAILTDNHWFGAFGKIAHFRLIQAKIPHVAHIRFENETSASKAMNWVNTELSSHGLSAKNGYRKYCPRFTQGKVCHSQQRCFVDKLHEWRPMSDVVNPEQVQRIKLQIQKKESIPANPQVHITQNGTNAVRLFAEKSNVSKFAKGRNEMVRAVTNQGSNRLQQTKQSNPQLSRLTTGGVKSVDTLSHIPVSHIRVSNTFGSSLDEIVNEIVDELFGSDSDSPSTMMMTPISSQIPTRSPTPQTDWW